MDARTKRRWRHKPWLTGGMLAVGLALLSPTASHADPLSEHQRRGAEYLRTQRYALALTELRAAYEIQQRPLLLYFMARCYHNMGQRQEAINHYDRYIVSETDPAQRADAQRYLDELTEGRSAAPESGRSPDGRPTERSGPRWGMVAAGATLFGLSYGSALVMGALGLAGLSSVSSSNNSDIGLARAGVGTLMVPLAGPLLSGLIIRSPEWSVPWTLINLPAQLVGMVLMGAGGQSQRTPSSSRLAVLPSLGPGSGSLVIGGTF